MDTQHAGAPRTTEFAWRVHATLEAWGVSVDRKAGLLLAHQGGAFVLGVTASARLWSPLIGVAMGLLLVGMCTAAAVILPVLGSARRLARERTDNLIYFGHLRTWDAAELSQELTRVNVEDELSMVSRQLVTLSRLGWRKHRLLQASAMFTLLAMCAGATMLVQHGH